MDTLRMNCLPHRTPRGMAKPLGFVLRHSRAAMPSVTHSARSHQSAQCDGRDFPEQLKHERVMRSPQLMCHD